MVVLKILIGLALLAVMLYALFRVNARCRQKFNVPLISKPRSICLLISSILLVSGVALYENARDSGGDLLNGILLLAVGVVLFIGMSFFTYKTTDLRYGTIGTLINLFLLGLITYVGLPLLVVYCALYLWMFFHAKPVYVVNK